MKKRTKSPDIPFNTAFKGMWLHRDPAEHSSKPFKENPITTLCLTAFPFKELPTAKPMGTEHRQKDPDCETQVTLISLRSVLGTTLPSAWSRVNASS